MMSTTVTAMIRRPAAILGLGLSLAMGAIAIGATAEKNGEDTGFKTIFDGSGPSGWINNRTGETISSTAVQDDGLNPHGTGAYVVLYEEPVKNFVLDFDYKLSPGCNSGVFLRVGDRENPVMTGLEIALDDTEGTGYHDPGAVYDLTQPKVNVQKPAGQWNHMTITAEGPIVTVAINGTEVNRIDQSRFTEPGKRPDGSNHKFRQVAIKDLIQKGYFGFQDHGKDCWFNNVKLKVLRD